MPLCISHLLGTCFSIIRHFPHPFELPLQPMAWICTYSGFAGTELPTLPANEEEAQVGLGHLGLTYLQCRSALSGLPQCRLKAEVVCR